MSRSLIQFDNTKDLGEWYDQKYTEMGGGWSMEAQTANEICEFIGSHTLWGAQSLLDVGCGEGHFVDHIKGVIKAVGIDCSQVIIQKAKEKFPDCVFIQADIETWQNSHRFDVITSVGSVEHCINIGDALNNIKRLLSATGVFYVLVPNEEWIHMDQPQEQTHTDEEWEIIFKTAGFSTLKHRRTRDLTEFLFKKHEN